MRIGLLLLLLAAVLSGLARAGDKYHPDANASQGSCATMPWSTAEIRYQTFVPAATLGAQPLVVSEIAFAPCASGIFSATQLEIRMAHFTGSKLSTIFASNFNGNLTTVMSGPVNWTHTQDQWSDVGLTSTFAYNGTDNLLIEVRFLGATGSVQCHAANAVRSRFNASRGAYNTPYAGPFAILQSPKMRVTFNETVLSGTGSPAPGGTVLLALLSTPDPNLPYQLGSSLGTGPIPIDTRRLGLSPDPLLVITVLGALPLVFQGYVGKLDAAGKAAAKIAIPPIPALKGLRLHSAFLTLQASAPSGVKSISNTFTFTIQ